jgi:lactate permease
MTSRSRTIALAFLSLAALLAVLLAALLLLQSNPLHQHWRQSYDPVGFWPLSTALAAAPVVVLLGLMAVIRLKAHVAALAGLATALIVAIAAFQMPARLAFSAAIDGAGYGLFPICWIVLPVIFLYQLTLATGRFEALKRSLVGITPDSRLQLLLIAFAFGAFFEGASGFGTPVAVCVAILVSLGFKPLHAAGLSLIANTAPVAFGSLGIPMIALHGVTGLDLLALTRMTAVLLAPFCFLVPFWLIATFAGLRAMLEVWPALLVASVTYTTAVLLMALFNGPWLVDIVASTATLVALVVFFRFWRPRRILSPDGREIAAFALESRREAPGVRETFKAWLPWLTLTVVIFAWGTQQFAHLADTVSLHFTVRGLDHAVERIPPVVAHATLEPAVFNLNWLAATGTGSLVAAVLAGLLMGLGPRALGACFLRTLFTIRFTVLTIAAMLAVGYVTRFCGLDATLGLAFARTGPLYPFFGAFIGWLGTASTGSDTSSNVLFGSLQQTTALSLGLPPVLMCATNSSAGIMGKMIAAPSVVVASTAAGSYGQEGSILRYVLLHSLALASLMGLWVLLLAHLPSLVAHLLHF